MSRLQLGVFASGRGSNFKSILKEIKGGRLDADIKLLITNNKDAGVLKIASLNSIHCAVMKRSDFKMREDFITKMLTVLKSRGVEFIVLAGYMKKIPPEVISKYKHRILNIHPALLPCFGGRGMYGTNVHRAVLESGCKLTGVTVHLVDNQYDHGPIVNQKSIPVKNNDTAEKLAARVLKGEHEIYPQTIQLFAEGRVKIYGKKVIIKKK